MSKRKSKNVMVCPFCGAKSKIYDSRITKRGTKLRRRECPNCLARYKTEELFAGIMEQPMPEGKKDENKQRTGSEGTEAD